MRCASQKSDTLAIDRATRFVHGEIVEQRDARTIAD
jgi:hypothetical protein